MDHRLQELTDRINEAIDELIDEFPDHGFMIAALAPVGEEETGVTVVTNVDSEELPEFLENVFGAELDPDVLNKHRLN